MAASRPAQVAKYLFDAPLGITAPGWAGMGVCIYLATRSLWFLFGIAFFAALGAYQRRIERKIKERKARQRALRAIEHNEAELDRLRGTPTGE
jgi:hypothetical protein